MTGWWTRVDPAEVPQSVKDAGARLPKRRPPVPGREPDRTTGIFQGDRYESGSKDKSIAADLVPHRGLAPLSVTYEHAEGKVAARMRRDNIREADFVVNNVVCGNNAWDKDVPYSCEKVLPSILPRGSRLTVWSTSDGGVTWWRHSYMGTGERIRS